MRVISLSNASSLDYGGATYEPGPDGVYDMPEPVGLELTTKHASMWVAETVHNAAITAAQLDQLRDPNHMVSVVADLLARVAALEAKVAGQTPQAAAAEPDPEPDPEPDEPVGTPEAGAEDAKPEPQPAAKKTTAKKTAPAKPKSPAAPSEAPGGDPAS